MKLSELAAGVPGASVEAGGEAEITGIVYDSRKARRGELFVAVSGRRCPALKTSVMTATRRSPLSPSPTVGSTTRRLPASPYVSFATAVGAPFQFDHRPANSRRIPGS